MSNVHVKRDDTVVVISGNDKGTVGKVLAVSPKEGKVIVKGVNIVVTVYSNGVVEAKKKVVK